MARYIDADAYEFPGDLINVPTADVVEVVQCKDCCFCEDVDYEQGIKPCVCRLLSRQMQEDDFCSYGKRKEVE